MPIDEMRILVTGANGFLGSQVASALADAGYPVLGMDIHPQSRTLPIRYEYVQGSFINAEDVKRAIEGAKAIFHFGSMVSPGPGSSPTAEQLEREIAGTLSLQQLALGAGAGAFVAASSGGTVYGPVAEPVPIPESTPCRPVSDYGKMKLSMELLLGLRATERAGLRTCILRIANPYSAGQSARSHQGLIPTVLGALSEGRPVRVWGDGLAVRDYLHVADVASAAVHYIEKGCPSGTYNIGSGVGRTVLQVISDVAAAAGITPQVQHVPAREVDVLYNVLDITSAQLNLGWSPKVDWTVGLRELVAGRRQP